MPYVLVKWYDEYPDVTITSVLGLKGKFYHYYYILPTTTFIFQTFIEKFYFDFEKLKKRKYSLNIFRREVKKMLTTKSISMNFGLKNLQQKF